MYTQGGLSSTGEPAIRGTIRGECAGPVLLSAETSNQERPLAATSARTGQSFVFFVPSGVSLEFLWGCDEDEDGAVAFAAKARVGALSDDLPLDITVFDGRRASAEGLVAERSAAVAPLAAQGAVAPPLAEAPPTADAPADGAVGPPLPEGPPADAGPPPTSGAAPPI